MRREVRYYRWAEIRLKTYGEPNPGCALRLPHAAESAGIHSGCRDHASAWHWCEYGGLQCDGCRVVAHAAGSAIHIASTICRSPPGTSREGGSIPAIQTHLFQNRCSKRCDGARRLDDVIAYVPLGVPKVAVRYGDTPEEAAGDEVSGNFFRGLTAGIFRGRGFSLDDEKDHSQVAVISYDYWTRRLARNFAVLGSTVFIKSVPFSDCWNCGARVSRLAAASSTDFWIPLQSRAELNAWGNPRAIRVFTALRNGGACRWRYASNRTLRRRKRKVHCSPHSGKPPRLESAQSMRRNGSRC